MSGPARRRSHCLPWKFPIYDKNFSAPAGGWTQISGRRPPQWLRLFGCSRLAHDPSCARRPPLRGAGRPNAAGRQHNPMLRFSRPPPGRWGGTAPRPLSRRGGGLASGAGQRPGLASSPRDCKSVRRAPPGRRRALETLLRQRITVCLPRGLGPAQTGEVLQDGRIAPRAFSGVIAPQQPLPGAAGPPAQ